MKASNNKFEKGQTVNYAGMTGIIKGMSYNDFTEEMTYSIQADGYRWRGVEEHKISKK